MDGAALQRIYEDRLEGVYPCNIPAPEGPVENFSYVAAAHPKAKVHVLIVPKNHVANVGELARTDPAQLAHIVEVAQSIADKEFHGEYRLVFNTGRDAGQTVFHAHAHVLTGEVLDE